MWGSKDYIKEKAVYLISEETFTKDFNIPENEIMNFAYYCAENYDLEILLDNPLELYEFFQSKAAEFKALKILDWYLLHTRKN